MSAVALTLACPACGVAQLSDVSQLPIRCPRCESEISVELFPAFYRSDEKVQHQAIVADEASCFFHFERVAEFTCSRCGRFLCSLCRISWAAEDLCPACLEAANRGENAKQLASTRFHYDSLALALSTLPVLTGIVSILTAPVALGYALFFFNRECSVAPRTKFRLVLAILFSTATIVAWVAFFIYAFRGRNVAPPVPLG
jgi:hypothetical protein